MHAKAALDLGIRDIVAQPFRDRIMTQCFRLQLFESGVFCQLFEIKFHSPRRHFFRSDAVTIESGEKVFAFIQRPPARKHKCDFGSQGEIPSLFTNSCEASLLPLVPTQLAELVNGKSRFGQEQESQAIADPYWGLETRALQHRIPLLWRRDPGQALEAVRRGDVFHIRACAHFFPRDGISYEGLCREDLASSRIGFESVLFHPRHEGRKVFFVQCVKVAFRLLEETFKN